MPTYLDDAPLAVDAATLDAALDVARRDAEAQGRLIVEVSLDGESLMGDRLDAAMGTAIGEAELRLYSADAAQVAGEALHEVRASIDRIEAMHQEAADELQRGDQAAGLATVGRVIELWLGVQRGIGQAAQVAGIELDGLTFGQTSATALFSGLLERLQELKGMIESGDTIALADALAYEWSEITEPWGALVDTLIAMVEAEPAA
ncbi:MAG: hypothetical protein AAFY08_00360 [Planctomycetota bacterium]